MLHDIGVSMPTIADLVARRLKDEGVRMLFGVPGGGGNLDLIDAANRVGLPFVLMATETAAAFAAIAQAEVTGKPGACLTTLGPGAASVVNGVACAFLDRAPLFVFTDTQGAAPGAAAQFEHQHLDQRAVFASITNWSGTLTADDASELLDRMSASVSAPRPGPVHIDCPGGVLGENRPRGSISHRILSESSGAAGNRPPRSILRSARRPIVILGVGARRPEDARAVRSLCERRGVPAMVTYKAKGVMPDDHSWFAGVFTNGVIERPLIDESDLVIGIGLDPVELLPRAWPDGRSVVYCGRWTVPTDHVPFADQLIGDLPATIDELATMIGETDWNPEHIRAAVDAQRQAVACIGRRNDGGLTGQRVVQMAAAVLAGESRVTVDAGAHMFPATMLWPVNEPNQMLISNGLSTMGFALPAAIGAALVDRSRPVVALTGDGGLLMCAGELLTAAREGLRIIVIVFNDASLSLIEIKQQARRLAPAGVALGATDWSKVAAGFGVTPFTATNETELQWALDRAIECDGPALIDARIDRSNYLATLKAIRG